MGAQYDSQSGRLTLEQAVELKTYRGGDAVEIHAQHAELDRGAQLCVLRSATADYRGGQAGAAQVKILFRTDGSAVRLDATGGFTLATATGGHLAAPVGWMEFDEHNQPRHAHMEGGVTMDSVNAVRTVHGTSPTAELEFTAAGRVAPRPPGDRRGAREPGNEPGRARTGAGCAAALEQDLALAGGRRGFPRARARDRWNRRPFTARAAW